ncbi:MAG: hypothetical protein B7Z20_11650 [Sphingobium sp. 32-64-5]|nr:MAG: hypothetical protein B7Z20_11650 [Sphingobium sp. 32-64-5]
MLPPMEIDQCILEIVAANFGARPDELVLAGARALGFAATSAQLKAVFFAGIERLIENSKLSEKEGLLLIA